MRDYSAAGLVFEDVLDQFLGVERYHYYGGLVRLAKGYGAWDMVDYEAALEHLSAARKERSVDFEDPALADRSSALLNRASGFVSRNDDDATAEKFFGLNKDVLARKKTVS